MWCNRSTFQNSIPALKQSGRRWMFGVSSWQLNSQSTFGRQSQFLMSETWHSLQLHLTVFNPSSHNTRLSVCKGQISKWVMFGLAGMLGCSSASSFKLLLFWRWVTGLGSALQMAGAQLFLSDISGPSNRARVLGTNQVCLIAVLNWADHPLLSTHDHQPLRVTTHTPWVYIMA